MELISGFVAVLVAGATLAAKGALSEIAKGTGNTIFESIKARLINNHNVKSMALLDDAENNDSFRNAIENELNQKDLVSDQELLQLIAQLQDIINSISDQELAKYAIDVNKIRSGRDVTFERVEGGIRSNEIDADGNVSFSDVGSTQKGN